MQNAACNMAALQDSNKTSAWIRVVYDRASLNLERIITAPIFQTTISSTTLLVLQCGQIHLGFWAIFNYFAYKYRKLDPDPKPSFGLYNIPYNTVPVD